MAARPALSPPVPDKLSLQRVQAAALLSAFPPTPDLAGVIERMGFVQADPIRAPARAQDLILRQRVAGYRAGDLERHYPELGLEEGYLYAYGFLTRALWQLRHPPHSKGLARREQRLLAAVRERGEVHPEQLQAEFGAARARNAWGGYSTVIKLTLERLHARGLLRVSRRQQGIRLYAPNPAGAEPPPREQAFAALAQTVTALLAPVPEASLRATLAPLARALRCDARALLAAQRAEGWLRAGTLDGVTYLWPALSADGLASELPRADQVPRVVRLLAPFDPLVWDRRRFEQLWGWAYRFEAYTPVKKRVRGYYALPLAWGSRVIGWANVARSAATLSDATPQLEVELGFVSRRPREREFGIQLEAELERMRHFLSAPEP